MSYPIYDRSGVDDDDRPMAKLSAPPHSAPASPREVLVCHAGTCRRQGAEAVLTEIEELVKAEGAEGGCVVRQSGCLGYCSEAPNAVVRDVRGGGKATVHCRIRSLEGSAKVVERATGKKVKLEDASANARLAELRAARQRQHAIAGAHWNAALNGMAEQAAQRPALRSEYAALLAKAGFPQGVVAEMPSAIDNYSPWTLEGVTAVSRHSAVFAFTSKDKKRGTPHPRGSGKLAKPVTWHATLLAQVGPNGEGPLPWVEREYTPISSAKEWEQGRCEILIKVYPDGAGTSWLHRLAADGLPASVWMSKPVTTLRVPDLVPDGQGRAFRPGSVLLLLAGTGVVALPQLLQHREPARLLGISTPRRDQLHVPIDVVVSCREDDVLLVPQLAQWCRDGSEGEAGEAGVRHCTLLLTPPNKHDAPFAATAAAEGRGDASAAEGALHGLPNARIRRTQLCAEVLLEATARMASPCRVIVSGPGPFNAAAQRMLAELGVDEDDVTVLSA